MDEMIDLWTKKLSFDGMNLEDAPEYVRTSKDLVLVAMAQNAYAYKHASNDLKENPDVALVAVRKNGNAL